MGGGFHLRSERLVNTRRCEIHEREWLKIGARGLPPNAALYAPHPAESSSLTSASVHRCTVIQAPS